jgi:hypothetical protein
MIVTKLLTIIQRGSASVVYSHQTSLGKLKIMGKQQKVKDQEMRDYAWSLN